MPVPLAGAAVGSPAAALRITAEVADTPAAAALPMAEVADTPAVAVEAAVPPTAEVVAGTPAVVTVDTTEG